MTTPFETDAVKTPEGGAASDRLEGESPHDVVSGGAGDDSLLGGTGKRRPDRRYRQRSRSRDGGKRPPIYVTAFVTTETAALAAIGHAATGTTASDTSRQFGNEAFGAYRLRAPLTSPR